MDITTVICPECGTENSIENDYCSSCGMALPRPDEEDVDLGGENPG
jgi:hypothetical protein